MNFFLKIKIEKVIHAYAKIISNALWVSPVYGLGIRASFIMKIIERSIKHNTLYLYFLIYKEYTSIGDKYNI